MERIKQENLPGKDFQGLRWGSHIPLNKSLLQTFPITGALELGAGFYSTKLFFDACPVVTSIENDLRWIEKLRSEYDIIEDADHQMIHHIIPPEIKAGTLHSNIPSNIIDQAIEFYSSYITPSMNYLFVDCFAGFRMPALNGLYQKFDVICYHDTEEKYAWQYDYHLFNPNEDYLHYMDRTFDANSGFLISKRFQDLLPAFLDNYAREAGSYADRFNADYSVNLIKQ